MSGRSPYHWGGEGISSEVTADPKCRFTPGPSSFAGMTCRCTWVVPGGLSQARDASKEVRTDPSDGARRVGDPITAFSRRGSSGPPENAAVVSDWTTKRRATRIRVHTTVV
jgi:hypothetical protein